MRIHIRFFATLRDRAGLAAVDLELPDEATVDTLLRALADKYPQLESALDSTLIAINHEYAFPDDQLNPNDEVALFPPVSGGTAWPEFLTITEERLSIDTIVEFITRPETGAVCVFSGAVRGTTKRHGKRRETEQLNYEAYKPMAERKLRQVAEEIRVRWPAVQGLGIVQRVGNLSVGEMTVLVACASGHRDEGCFEAARYGIDRLKEIVPVWKQEIGPDGSTWVEGNYRPTPDDVSHDPSTTGPIHNPDLDSTNQETSQ